MENLIGEAKKGNLKAQNELCRFVRKRIIGYCITLTKCASQAEDLAQETLIRVIQKLDKFNSSGKIESWAKSIARNLFIDETRKNRSRSYDPQDVLAISKESTEPEFYTNLNREETAQKIKKFMETISTLPPKTQEVFRLHYIDGIKHREISKMLGIDEGTSKSQCHKGRHKMREILGEKIIL